eukprot:1145935-Rhodomonas_salina.2
MHRQHVIPPPWFRTELCGLHGLTRVGPGRCLRNQFLLVPAATCEAVLLSDFAAQDSAGSRI